MEVIWCLLRVGLDQEKREEKQESGRDEAGDDKELLMRKTGGVRVCV